MAHECHGLWEKVNVYFLVGFGVSVFNNLISNLNLLILCIVNLRDTYLCSP